MERTGHRDPRPLQIYQRPSILDKVETSKAFDCTSEYAQREKSIESCLVNSNRKRVMGNETNNASKVKKVCELSVEESHGLNNS